MGEIFFVAEIGCNHNGSYELAKQMLYKAKECGATAVKFQTFKAANLVSKNAEKAEYQKKTTNADETQLDMLKKLELSDCEYRSLLSEAKKIDIDIFSTAFDLESIDRLSNLGQNMWKIPSGEINNYPYICKIANLNIANKHIILSTGMSTLSEIDNAVHIIENGIYDKLTILHCNTEYPTSDNDMNLRVLELFQERYPSWEIGLSDHSRGIVAPLVAIGLGATFIEKHFTLDNNMLGPDHKASIMPNELAALCEAIKRANLMLGKREKVVTESEKKNKFIARKSIVALRQIKKGECFTKDNLVCKRPGYGISPIEWDNLIGNVANRDFKDDEMITHPDFIWERDKE